MAFDLTQTQFDSVRALNAGTDDIPELTPEQLTWMKPLYNAEERAILMNNPTLEQRSVILRDALHRIKQESKQ